MKLLRFISQKEYDTLANEGRVVPVKSDRAWSGKKRLFTFPIGPYELKDYLDVKEYLEVAYDIDYDYMITIEPSGYYHETFAAYDKEMMDMTLGRYTKFDIDDDAYDSGDVYVIPEVLLDAYTTEEVIDIKPLENGQIQESNIPDEDIEIRGNENWLVNDVLYIIYPEIMDIPFSFAKDWIINMYKKEEPRGRHELYLSLVNNIDELYEITMALVRDYKSQGKA